MRAARIDLQTTTFRRTVRGFDPGDVQAFLDLIAPDYEAAHAERERMREAVDALSRELEAARQTERTLMQMLSGAAQDADALALAARADAERILAEANARAGALLGAHDEWRRGVEAEIAGMRRKQDRALEALVALVGELEHGGDLPTVPAAPPSPNEQAPVVAITKDQGVGPSTQTTPLADAPALASRVPFAEPAMSEPASATEPEPATEDVWPSFDELPPTSRLDEPFDDHEFEEVATPARRRSLFRLASIGAVLAVTTCVAVLAWPGAGEAPAGTTPPPESQEPVVVTAEIPAPTPAEPVLTDPLVVRLEAMRECWVGLTVDGRPESRLLAPGEHIIRGANRTIHLRAGDAAALSVTVNGRALGPLGKDGQVVDRRFEADAATGN
jgi:DivIVA domain-containing protein